MLANQEHRLGNYATAIDLYRRALQAETKLASMIQFNLGLAQQRLLKITKESIPLSTKIDLPTDWVPHETLQNSSNIPRIVLGGMVLGYPEKGNNTIPPRVAECVRLYEQISQIQDWHCLRIITGENLTRPPSPTSNPSALVHAFATKDVTLAAIWYANSRDLHLSIEKEPSFNLTHVLRAYQYDPVVGGGLVLVGDYVLQGADWQLTDLVLVNPYLPVLLTLGAPDGYLTDAALIPYPSLLPGGIHEHECYVGTLGNDPKSLAQVLLQEHLLALRHGWAMGQLQVDIREAIGIEAILSNDFKEWLWSIFSLRIKPWRPPDLSQALAEYWQEVFSTPPLMRSAEKKFSSQSAREREGRVLLCPPHAIPSLRALTISRSLGELEQTCGVSQFILVQEGPLTQRWRLRWPDMAANPGLAVAQDDAIRVPLVLVGKNDVTKQNPENSLGVSAILMSETVAANALQLIMPIAPDFAGPSLQTITPAEVDVVVTAVDLPTEIFSAFLDSLLLQRVISLRQIVVILPSAGDQKTFDKLLKRNYAGRYLLLPAREAELYKQRVQRATAAIKRHPDDAYMVFINQPLVLHDPRTLATLAQALAIPKTATTSALLIGNIETKSKPETVIFSSSLFPVLRQSKTETEWHNENLAVAIPRTTLPVASHGDALFMIKTKEWKKSGGFAGIEAEDENALHEYSAKLCARNKLHLLIPNVTVELHAVTANLNSSRAGWKPAANLTCNSNAVCIEVLPS